MLKNKRLYLLACTLLLLGNIFISHKVSAIPTTVPKLCGFITGDKKVYRSESGLDGVWYDDIDDENGTGVYVDHTSDEGGEYDHLFKVKLTPIENCSSSSSAHPDVSPVKVYGNYSFKCISRHKGTTTSSDFRATDGIWVFLYSEGGYDHYRVTFPPKSEDDQAIQGEVTIKMTRFLLYATPVDEEGNRIGDDTKSEEMNFNNAVGNELVRPKNKKKRAKVERPLPDDLSGYTFLGWSEVNNPSGILTPKTEYRGKSSLDDCRNPENDSYSTCWDEDYFVSYFPCSNGACMDKTVYAIYKDDKVKLTAEPIDATTGDPVPSCASVSSKGVSAGGAAEVNKPSCGTSWQFVGWHTNRGKKKYDGDGLDRSVNKYTKIINDDEIVYAYFVRKWSLSKSQGSHTTITVTRSSSQYGGGSTGSANLANGTVLYQGDVISASFSVDAENGYSWNSQDPHIFSYRNSSGREIKDRSLTVSDHVVGSNVTVSSSAEINSYTLTSVPIDIISKQPITCATNGTTQATHGSKATVSQPNFSGCGDASYEFRGWSTSQNETMVSTLTKGSTYSVDSMVSNVTVYAYYRRKWVLTIDQGEGTTIAVSRVTSTGSKSLTDGATLYQGDSLNVKMCISSGYTWNEHKVFYKNDSGGTVSKSGSENENCFILNHTVGSNVKVRTRATVNTFEGKSDVASSTTDWTKASKTIYHQIDNCSPVNGCKVTFKHYLRRSTGSGSVTYSISRSSNYSGGEVDSGTLVSNATEGFGSGDSVTVYTDKNLVLYPGQKVCETLTFKPSALSDNVAELKTCVLVLGKAQPDGDGLFINIRVKNNTGSNVYKTYQKYVYAKPGDELTYIANYNPVLQYTYSLYPEKIQIDGGTIQSGGGKTVGNIFNDIANKNGFKNWNNAFTVNGDDFRYKFTNTYNKYASGSTSEKTETNEHLVDVHSEEVGKELKEIAKTNDKDEGKTTPSQVIFTRRGDEILGNVITSSISSNAIAAVPYNFNTEIEITSEDGTLVAGGSKTIEYNVDILPKENSLTTNGGTDEAYTTIVRDATSKVIIYTTKNTTEKDGTSAWGGDLCSYYNGATSCREEESKHYESLENSIKQEYTLDVPDVEAGHRICIAIAFYPSSSGADNNLSASGSGKWRISKSKCFVVGKNPTFQVWGGSFYSAGNVSTSTTIKRRLTISGSSEALASGALVFSSWAEQSVVSNGEVKGLASGAATGLANNIAGGGSLESGKYGSYCKHRIPLSFANYAERSLQKLCVGSSGDGASGYSGITINTDKETFINPLPGEVSEERGCAGGVDFSTSDKNTIRHSCSGDLTIGSATIEKNKTHIIKTTGNVTIDGNIQYAEYDSTSYTTLTQIPKLIIYAKGNININCGVSRIDAVLITEGIVTTCANSNDINNEINSNQLVINGAILASNLTLNRTYGASVGTYSKIPAEIVNFDTSILLWGRGKVDTDDGTIHQVYLHELAPRY